METSGNVLVLSGLINPDYHPNLKFIRRKRGEGGVIVRWRNVEGMVGNTEDMFFVVVMLLVRELLNHM